MGVMAGGGDERCVVVGFSGGGDRFGYAAGVFLGREGEGREAASSWWLRRWREVEVWGACLFPASR